MTNNSPLEWKHFFNSIKDPVIILDTNGIIRDCNKAFLEFVNKPKIQIIGSDCTKIIYDKTSILESCPFHRSKKSKKRESLTIKKEDNWFKVDIDPIFDENNKITGFVQFMSDITERKKLQESLMNSEERYRSLSEASFQAIFISEKGICIEQNSIAEKMFGYTLSDAIGRSGTEWIAPKYREMVINNMLSGYEKPYEATALRKDGSTFPAEIQGKMIPYKGRTVRVTALRDITERKKAEKALRESEEKFRTLTENINVGIYRNTVGAKGKFIEANPAIVKMFGFKNKKEFLAHNVSELYLHPEERQKFNDEMFKSGFVKDEELQLKKKDGKHFWGSVSAVTIKDKDGHVQFYDGIIEDITERKKAELALKESEERFKQLVENANDIIYRLDANGHVVYVNPVTLKLGNYTKKDLIGINYLDIVHPDYYHEAKRFFRNQLIKKTKNKYKELPIKTKNGSYVWLGQNVQLLFEKDKIVGFQAVARDITEQKKSDLALQENEKRYRSLFNQSPTSIWEEDFSEVYKYITSLKKSGINDFREYFENHPDEVKKCSKMVQIIDINEMTIKLFNAKNKKDLITNLGSILIEESLQSFIDQLCSIADNNTRYTGEIINRTLDGKLLNVIIKLNVVPGYEKDYSRVLISLMDITKLKKAEDELITGRERLKMLNKIIRHDIANDFIVIKSAINIFRRSSDAKMINEIENRVDKSLLTIDSYRKYESFIDLNQDLEELEITELFSGIIVEFPKIEFNIHGKCKVFADNALDSVFTNLISNSIKHGNSTKIDIEISSKENICKIKFMDNGTGIPDKIKDKVFNEGFFHGQTGNTGIGLHIVRKTIERYGGSISVEDNEPNGTIFKINLKKAL